MTIIRTEQLWRRTTYSLGVALIVLATLIPARLHGQTDIVVSELLIQIKHTLLKVEKSTAAEELPPLAKVTLNLKSALRKKTGSKLSLYIIEFGKEVRGEVVQGISLELASTPKERMRSQIDRELISESLAEAIIQSATAAASAQFVPPVLYLRKLTATVRFGVSSKKGGGINFNFIASGELGKKVEKESIQELIVEFER